ncbi:MAG: hypothetical protein JW709_00335 [Sedimentisphaerales bacterium]|nr:hypothetical protein [Sedimentisphaerales bacterium]
MREEKGETRALSNNKFSMSPQRYLTLRRLCRKLNCNRRRLRDQVDLLCNDLVTGNVALTHTVSRLQLAYEFQNVLLGEYDVRYLLCKALRFIRECIYESGAAIYLFSREEFTAHLTGAWYDDPGDINQIESALRRSTVAAVRRKRCGVLAPDGQAWQEIPANVRRALGGLSLMGLGVFSPEGELQGVLTVYRDISQPLTENERCLIEPLMVPLGKALTAVTRVHELLPA